MKNRNLQRRKQKKWNRSVNQTCPCKKASQAENGLKNKRAHRILRNIMKNCLYMFWW